MVVDKGALVNSLIGYPTNMEFFSTPKLLEKRRNNLSCPNGVHLLAATNALPYLKCSVGYGRATSVPLIVSAPA
ncbi:hypothetical protein [Hymenobacter sp. 15J16-1T3B]|uniref:hypothetical protein n=1 Tax=Hymenobacter sp. 15J16-1T3B TaxID=2886941 RepID=UPI00397A67FC